MNNETLGLALNFAQNIFFASCIFIAVLVLARVAWESIKNEVERTDLDKRKFVEGIKTLVRK
jgi:hypothetical protein